MTRALIVAFDASQLVLGMATAQVPALKIRILAKPQTGTTLSTLMRIDQGGELEEVILNGLRTRYQTEIVAHPAQPEIWEGEVDYLMPAQLAGHPIYDALLWLAPLMVRTLLHFQDGICVLRVDLTDGLAQEVRTRFDKLATKIATPCQYWMVPAKQNIDVWEPLIHDARRVEAFQETVASHRGST